jgi:hypothetical protein
VGLVSMVGRIETASRRALSPPWTPLLTSPSLPPELDDTRPHICVIDANITPARRNTCFREGCGAHPKGDLTPWCTGVDD